MNWRLKWLEFDIRYSHVLVETGLHKLPSCVCSLHVPGRAQRRGSCIKPVHKSLVIFQPFQSIPKAGPKPPENHHRSSKSWMTLQGGSVSSSRATPSHHPFRFTGFSLNFKASMTWGVPVTSGKPPYRGLYGCIIPIPLCICSNISSIISETPMTMKTSIFETMVINNNHVYYPIINHYQPIINHPPFILNTP